MASSNGNTRSRDSIHSSNKVAIKSSGSLILRLVGVSWYVFVRVFNLLIFTFFVQNETCPQFYSFAVSLFVQFLLLLGNPAFYCLWEQVLTSRMSHCVLNAN